MSLSNFDVSVLRQFVTGGVGPFTAPPEHVPPETQSMSLRTSLYFRIYKHCHYSLMSSESSITPSYLTTPVMYLLVSLNHLGIKKRTRF